VKEKNPNRVTAGQSRRCENQTGARSTEKSC